MSWSNLKSAIDTVIDDNGAGNITGPVLNAALDDIIDALGALHFKGVAVPATNPTTPDGVAFYFAAQNGTYSNFGGATLSNEIAVLYYDGSWTKVTVVTFEAVVSATVINALNNTSETKPLSANQGKVLNDKVVVLENNKWGSFTTSITNATDVEVAQLVGLEKDDFIGYFEGTAFTETDAWVNGEGYGFDTSTGIITLNSVSTGRVSIYIKPLNLRE